MNTNSTDECRVQNTIENKQTLLTTWIRCMYFFSIVIAFNANSTTNNTVGGTIETQKNNLNNMDCVHIF